ncbi:hypothetical protein CMV_017649 [Castanea mollissima]|uniref:Uncharacterized protein n=1 Tax=Castanea mollissima TaxID=60419 RepID=A0A8J4VDI3_9ROSI|nr:hypothetical protein CMV_017649 [Castanea mollissima]
MEIQDLREHITQSVRDTSNPTLKVIDSNPELNSFHTNNADFETQIQKLDLAIGNYDKRGEHVDPRTADTSQVLAKNGKQLTPSSPAQHAASLEQATHVVENSTPPIPTNGTLRMCKRLARETNMETDIPQGPTVTKRSREEVLEYFPRLPTKKLQVSKEDS